MDLEILGYTMWRVRLWWLASLPHDSCRHDSCDMKYLNWYMLSWREVELFFEEFHGKGASYTFLFKWNLNIENSGRMECQVFFLYSFLCSSILYCSICSLLYSPIHMKTLKQNQKLTWPIRNFQWWFRWLIHYRFQSSILSFNFLFSFGLWYQYRLQYWLQGKKFINTHEYHD